MKKVMLYVGLAILLGTVTMIAPLALLSPDDKNLLTTPESVIMVPETTEPSDQESFARDKSLDAGNYSVQATIPEQSSVVPMEPSEVDTTGEVPPEGSELILRTADSPTDLSPVGLMAVPSFLVALGIFVYLRKRTC